MYWRTEPGGAVRVIRISHSAAVAAWRGREHALRGLGVDVTLFAACRWDAGGAEVTLAPGDDVHTHPVRTWGRHPALFVYNPRPLWRALGESWDVVDIHEEPFSLAAAEVRLLKALRRNPAPYVLYSAQNLRKRYPIPFRWLERSALRHASGISACNSEAALICESKGFPGRARVIPLGVDVGDGAGADAGRRRAVGNARITVGLIGRLVPEKGIDVLMDAVARSPRLGLRIAGAGPLADELADRAAERGIAERFEFVGAIPPHAVGEFYRGVDVLAVPSSATKRWTEQFGRVAVEAMAHGTPVVSSDAGSLPDVVGGAGIVVRQGDAAALADALLAAGGERRDDLRVAGLRRAAECSWEAVGHQYIELYRSTGATASHSAEQRDIEVVVVAYGAPELLRAALTPVAGMAITVVDNSSRPDIAALCAEAGVRYIDSGGNIGFGAAVNLALEDRLLPGADVLLLNPDARITPDQIALLQGALRSAPDLASVGPEQVDESGRSAQVEWVFPSPARAWLGAAGLASLQRGPRFVIGSILLLRAEALDQVGSFDERFFLYAEETDWAFRAHLLGWRHAAAPGVRGIHVGAGTSRDDRLREAHFHASQERYFRKHFGWTGWQTARAAAWTGAMARALVLKGERGRAARRRAALYRLGPARIERRLTGRAA
jgi:glycosyltransferase involved in cell wall biosynthesis/GT2 family glycosyltransferase